MKNRLFLCQYRAFTLVEILIAAAILAIIGLVVGSLIQRSTRQFSIDSWNQKTIYQLEGAIQRINKFLKLASYPTLNAFKGVIRDRNQKYALTVSESNLERNESFSANTEKLSSNQSGEGGILFDSGTARAHFFGSGIKTDLSEDFTGGNRYSSNSAEQTIIQWTSCRPGYDQIPGFSDSAPRCGKHRLFLKNRQSVRQPIEGTYFFFQDLFLESSFCVKGRLNPKNGSKGYITGMGIFECNDADYISEKSDLLTGEERDSAGLKLLVNNVATTTVKVFNNEKGNSTSVEIDIVAVAPLHGQRVLKRATQINISPEVIEDGAGYLGK